LVPSFNSASMSKPDATLGLLLVKVQEAIEKYGSEAPCYWDLWHPGVFQHYWEHAVTSIKEAHKVGDCTLSIDGIKEQMPPKEMQKVANKMTYDGSLKPWHDWLESHDIFAEE